MKGDLSVPYAMACELAGLLADARHLAKWGKLLLNVERHQQHLQGSADGVLPG